MAEPGQKSAVNLVLCVSMLLLVGCGSQGINEVSDGQGTKSQDVVEVGTEEVDLRGGSDLSDGGIQIELVLPDSIEAISDIAPADVSDGDSSSDIIPPVDILEVDLSSSDAETNSEYEAFQQCTSLAVCPNEWAPLCLLLPNSEEEGICVTDCSDSELDCPPWLSCVAPDSSNPTFRVCLKMRQEFQTCDNATGMVCGSGLNCMALPETAESICARFCSMEDSLCPTGTVCQGVDPLDPSPEWGACLPLPQLPTCSDTQECPSGRVCVPLTGETGRCLLACETVGKSCDGGGRCLTRPDMSGENYAVCAFEQKPGEICADGRGVTCSMEGECIGLPTPDLWDRCLGHCVGGDCSGTAVCILEGAGDFCAPIELSSSPMQLCSDLFPCQEEQFFCSSLYEEGAGGICLKGCDATCQSPYSCVNGLCQRSMSEGDGCCEAVGAFCEAPLQCIKDNQMPSSPGSCLRPCTPSDDACPTGTECLVPAGYPVDQSFCAERKSFGESCANRLGQICGTELSCVGFGDSSPGDMAGVCTLGCDGAGSCPSGPPGTFAECILKNDGNWFCGFLCGLNGAVCPSELECNPSVSVCQP